MTDPTTATGYLVASILFILSLAGLSHEETAERGNAVGIAGMVLAILITITSVANVDWTLAVGTVTLGAIIGVVMAVRVAMTSMPQMVAIFNSFVGLAAVLVSASTWLEMGDMTGAKRSIHLGEIYIDAAIGALTFTGSVVAWGKLGGVVTSEALDFPGRHVFNGLMLLALIVGAVPFVGEFGLDAGIVFGGGVALASLLGIMMVLGIGGADMPVVVSLLNSYSGWAAAGAGFMLKNDLLIVTGALVGSSGAILSYIMCEGMNRSLTNVLLGGWGGEEEDTGGESDEYDNIREASTGDVAQVMRSADRVAIVPGYGMAVAGAQHAVSRLTRQLREQDKEVSFGIHPVAGRMPGHMNVLLAEADVPYDLIDDLETINPTFPDTDVVLVVGANDIVNPDAADDPSTPIYGMPQLEVWNAEQIFVIKRSLSTGYAGVPNPLFDRENASMYFGDALENVRSLADELE